MTRLTREQVQEIMQANPNATTFEVPEGITSIEGSAFWGCSGLRSIELPKGLESIGEDAFRDCRGLTLIKIPEGVTSIGKRAFSSCIELTSINIPEGVTSIEDCVFSDCRGLKTIEIPEGVTSIGDGAFENCRGLKTIEIPEGVTSIGDGAFFWCSGLTSIELPRDLKSIGEGAFSDCGGLTSINIPEGVTHIGRFVFDGCSGLKSIVIPDSVTSIGHGAFKGCSQLELIIAPEHLHDNFRTEYPDKTIMTQAQCDNAIARKIQQHTQGSSSAQDTEKITEMVKTLSPGTKASLMALEIPEGQTFSNLSTEALVQCFGDEPASLLPLLGIEAKELAIKDNLDVGSLVESHLTVRDKLILDATVKGEVLKQPRPNNTVKTSRVISLGQSLEASDSLSMQSDQGSQEGAVEEKPSTTSPTPRS